MWQELTEGMNSLLSGDASYKSFLTAGEEGSVLPNKCKQTPSKQTSSKHAVSKHAVSKQSKQTVSKALKKGLVLERMQVLQQQAKEIFEASDSNYSSNSDSESASKRPKRDSTIQISDSENSENESESATIQKVPR